MRRVRRIDDTWPTSEIVGRPFIRMESKAPCVSILSIPQPEPLPELVEEAETGDDAATPATAGEYCMFRVLRSNVLR